MIKLKEIIKYKKINDKKISINNITYQIEIGKFENDIGFYLQEKNSDDYICYVITTPAKLADSNKIVKNTYIIDDIETKNEYQRMGLATFLFKYAQNYFKKQNKKLVHSPTTTDAGEDWIDSLKND